MGGVSPMPKIQDTTTADTFLKQFGMMLINIYTYETIIGHGDDVVFVSNLLIDMLKHAAWERFDSLMALGELERAQVEIESGKKIIERLTSTPAPQVSESLRA